MEALGQCIRWGSFRSLSMLDGLDVSEIKAVLDRLSGGATFCYGYDCVH